MAFVCQLSNEHMAKFLDIQSGELLFREGEEDTKSDVSSDSSGEQPTGINAELERSETQSYRFGTSLFEREA